MEREELALINRLKIAKRLEEASRNELEGSFNEPLRSANSTRKYTKNPFRPYGKQVP